MVDLFEDKAGGWDQNPVPVQISRGVLAAVSARVAVAAGWTVLDFGAGTGLLAGGLAPKVRRIHAVDVSAAMLGQLEAKEELRGKVQTHLHDLVKGPLGLEVDLVVSAMAMHHVADTGGLVRALYAELKPGGVAALADLDSEDGSFHPAGAEGVFHQGFDRGALGALLGEAGFVDVTFDTALEVQKEGRKWPVFLVTARRPGRSS